MGGRACGGDASVVQDYISMDAASSATPRQPPATCCQPDMAPATCQPVPYASQCHMPATCHMRVDVSRVRASVALCSTTRVCASDDDNNTQPFLSGTVVIPSGRLFLFPSVSYLRLSILAPSPPSGLIRPVRFILPCSLTCHLTTPLPGHPLFSPVLATHANTEWQLVLIC